MKNWLKINAIHFLITGIFIALCYIYFSPVLSNKMLFQGDVLEAKAMSKEIMDFKAKTGEGPLWTNSMFGGMPSFQIWARYPYNVTTYVVSFFKATFPNPIDTILIYLMGTYLLFSVLGLRPWLAAGAAIAFSFSSFNFIVIEAGHSNQAFAIAFFAPILAGIIMALRGKYMLGASLTALFLAMELRANHIQMTYYLFVAILILVGFELYAAVKAKTLPSFLKSLGYLAAAAVLAIGVNAGILLTTYEYGQESIRGKANLAKVNSAKDEGLDKDYAYHWSQGIGEMITVLIPDAYGGASSTQLSNPNSEVVKTMTDKGVSADQALGLAKQLPVYWGEKPGTSGPWYFGAIVCFFAVVGLFVIKGSMKYWIVAASLLFMFLSFGKNFPLVSDLFFHYMPLYNKFRSVEFTLIIPALLIPLLAFLAIRKANEENPEQIKKILLKSFYIVGGFLLVLIVVPNLFFDFRPSSQPELVQGLTRVTGEVGFAQSIGDALIKDRISIFRQDAFRSLIFIVLGAGLVWFIIKKKIAQNTGFIVLALLVLVDMWGIDKRYLNATNFVDANQTDGEYVARPADELILQDPALDYRVLDLSRPNPFGNATASYFHKSVAGRHSARLQRYQEMLDRQFNGSLNEPVLDMLNTKYLIVPDSVSHTEKVITRSSAAGNAWFVQNLNMVKSAQEEVTAITSFDPKKDAFVHQDFKDQIAGKQIGFDPNAKITMLSYHPDNLVYEYTSAKQSLAVFAEIWYNKGWKAYVDQKEIPYLRANYILRAAILPEGSHKLEFRFEPQSYLWGERISLFASILLIAALIFELVKAFRKPSPLIKGN